MDSYQHVIKDVGVAAMLHSFMQQDDDMETSSSALQHC